MRKVILYSFILFLSLTSCKEANTIVLGGVIPLSGNSSDLGQSTSHAMELCAEKWNKLGGIIGNHVVLDLNDSQADPKLGITLTQKIFAKHNPLLVYSLVSGVALNVQSVTKKNGSILMACIGSAELFENDTLYTLRNFVSPTTVGEGISSFILDNYKDVKLSIMYINNTFGDSYAQKVKSCSENKGIFVKQMIPYDESNSYRDVIVKANLKEKDILYIAGVGQSIGVIIKQLRESGFKGVVLGDPNLPNNSALSVAGESMDNVFYLDINRPDTKEFKDFEEKYVNRFQSNPDNFAIIAHATCDYILDIAAKYKTVDTKEILKIANKGYSYNSIIGTISIINNEFVFPTRMSNVK